MVIRHGGLTAAERIKKAVEVCKQGCSPYCPYWTEDECRTLILTDCAEAIAERDERIAIMQESMETLEKRCNTLNALEQRCKALEVLEKRLKDPDRIKVVRCKDCRYFEPSNAEEGDNSGYCRNDYAPCQNQTVDAWWYCGSAERGSE